MLAAEVAVATTVAVQAEVELAELGQTHLAVQW